VDVDSRGQPRTTLFVTWLNALSCRPTAVTVLLSQMPIVLLRTVRHADGHPRRARRHHRPRQRESHPPEHTVRKHLENIFDRLGVHARTAAVAVMRDDAGQRWAATIQALKR